MRKTLIFTVLAMCSTLSASTGKWDVGGKVGLEQNGDNIGLKSAVKAEYHLSRFLTWRTDFEVMLPDLNDVARVDISVPTNMLFYPFGSRIKIDPYLGPGLTYRYAWNNEHQLGANFLAGVNFHLIKNNVFGIEAKYTFLFFPELRGAFGVGLTGTWELNLGE